MFSIATPPAKQSVGETITTLSGRLSSSTLLEDRRAAILGLRSFAKDFPASVASGALRSLIGSLAKDGEDVDTVKIVLETLLMLFSPNEESPEASDEIALWLADEFTQRQENITLLLDFLETNDFYSRLYSLQLLGAILSARTERTEECIFTAPLGISRLVAILDDQRDAVRNEGITLLTFLTPSSIDIQKLVAFESAFEKLFAIINADGSLVEGGRTVEDCLILIANLLRRNASNQALFRESGCVVRLSELLANLLKAQDSESAEIAGWAETQRNRNVYAFLAVVRLFLGKRFNGTPQNQVAFWKHNVTYHVLQLAFSDKAQPQIKAEALITGADLIRRNPSLQESFAQIMVNSPLATPVQTKDQANGLSKVYVIDGLLDTILSLSDLAAFDVRFAACECLKAYFSDHSGVKLHFLGRAIEGFGSQRDESSNVLSVLLDSDPAINATDPYRVWFAAIVVMHLLHDSPDAKAKALALTEGDEEHGEEVVTSLHTIAARLVTGIRRDDDPRVLIANLMLLCVWLYEDLDAINDFLMEGSNAQNLIQTVTQTGSSGDELVAGLCAMLLGILYEFSTKDSPIPRATLHEILTSRIDRERYADRLAKLRSHPLIRDFEVIPQKLDNTPPGELPDVFMDAVFVEFLKDNYNRVSRSLDREPGMEISVVSNGVQKGISRELVDELRAKVEEKERAVQEAQSAVATLEGKLGQEQADHRKSKESVTEEVAKAKSAAEHLQRTHEAELRKLQSQMSAKEVEAQKALARVQSQIATKENDHKKELARFQSQQSSKESEHQKALTQARKAADDELAKLRSQQAATKAENDRLLSEAKKIHDAELTRLKSQQASKETDHEKALAEARKTAEQDAERVKRRVEAEAADLKATISRLEVDVMKANKAEKSKTQELQTLKEAHEKALAAEKKRASDAESKLAPERERADESEKKLKEFEAKLKDSEKKLGPEKKRADDAEKKLKESETKLKESEKKLKESGDKLKEAEKKLGESEKKLKEAVTKAVEAGKKAQPSSAGAGKASDKANDKVMKEAEELRKKAAEAEKATEAAKKATEDATRAKDETQTELDDLLMVFGDLEEKVEKYKKRLTALGEQVSDGEDDDDDDDEDDDEEDEDDQ